MKSLIAAVKGARGLEWFAGIVIIAILAAIFLGDDQDGRTETPLEARLEALLEAIPGVEKAHVMIAEDDAGHTTGAVVVAKGTMSVKTYLEIQTAVQALLKVDAGQIEIIVPEGWGGG